VNPDENPEAARFGLSNRMGIDDRKPAARVVDPDPTEEP